ncbi:hypothetical protein M433DRAFT_236916 [Acidomyces richmondensis BFW]|nr:hypothetical protein M433DRAFT_236916 [Acidomyces richmondensis BFW]
MGGGGGGQGQTHMCADTHVYRHTHVEYRQAHRHESRLADKTEGLVDRQTDRQRATTAPFHFYIMRTC